MSGVQAVASFFRVPRHEPALIEAQIAAFSRQVPLLYFIVIVNTASVAYTHFHIAPLWLAVLLPGILCAICALRLFGWLRLWNRVIPHEQAVKRLSTTTRLVVVLGIAFLGWSLMLFPYGGAAERSHVVFEVAMTVLGCIFCLTHVRGAAFLLSVIVLVPFTAFLVQEPEPVYSAMALNLVLVSIGMLLVLLTSYRDFAKLVASQQNLLAINAETQRLNEENLRLATRDSLTGLANRRFFLSALDKTIAACRPNETFALFVIDLDGFKAVNDVYGHMTGDQVLIDVGRRMLSQCDSDMTVARLGGDEFAVICPYPWPVEQLEGFGRDLCRTLELPYVLTETTARLGASVGFALYPAAADSAEQLFERADYALNFAKQHARGKPVLFSAEHEAEIRTQSTVEQNLRRADLRRELSLVFQPIVEVEHGRTVGFEALGRWNSPVLGAVAPDLFIKVAERSDLINQITEVLLDKALTEAATWPKHLKVSFNLSIRDIASPEAGLRVAAVILRSKVEPSRIELEITETAVMTDFGQASETLRLLKDLGVGISLDDFGTGHSSLGYVHRLPLDKIKIDRSFIADIDTNDTCRDIVKTIVDLCRNLKLACVVEGTETATQLEVLRELGCETMQGYLFARPMSAEDIAGHLSKNFGEAKRAAG